MAIDWISVDSQLPRRKGVYAVVTDNGWMVTWCKAWWAGTRWMEIGSKLEGVVTYWAEVELPQ